MRTILKKWTGNFLLINDKVISYEELDSHVEYLENRYKYIQDGETIIIYGNYSVNSIGLLLALGSKRVKIAPVVPTTNKELKNRVEALQPNRIFNCTEEEIIVEDVSEKIDVKWDIDKSRLIIFSSGSTGVPKIMEHDFELFLTSFGTAKRQKNLTFIITLLFDHIGGLNTLFHCLSQGVAISIPKDNSVESVVTAIKQHKVNVLPTSPTFLNLLVQSGILKNERLASLRLITYGTEKMPVVLLERLHNNFPRVKLMQTFGTSETGILKTQSKSSNSLFFKIVDPDVNYKIENNELLLSTTRGVKGYENVGSDKFRNGWFYTGDLVELDNEGFIRIVGRKSHVINVGGLKVLPEEVEKVVNSIKGVIDSTAFAQDNPITGQMVAIEVIVENQDDEPLIREEIKAICSKQLEKYKRPVRIIFENQIRATHRLKKARR